MSDENGTTKTRAQRGFPQESHYEDRGCADAGVDSCLKCPLPMCVHDMAHGEVNRLRRLAVDRRKVEVIRSEGLTLEEASARFGITPRTVSRVLARVRKAEETEARKRTIDEDQD